MKPARSAGSWTQPTRRGMRVVAWYVPGFTDLRLDLRACRPRFGSVAHRPALRRVRPGHRVDARPRVLGTEPPGGRALQAGPPEAGPTTPWPRSCCRRRCSTTAPPTGRGSRSRSSAPLYDVFMPMGYWTYRYGGLAGPTTSRCEPSRDSVRVPDGPRCRSIRSAASPTRSTPAEMPGFMRAVREFGVIGASLYDVGTSDAGDWAALRDVLAMPVQNPPSPLALGKRFDAYGNLPSGDTAHPRDVAFRVGRRTGAWELDFELFAVDQAEVSVLVNWKHVATLTPGTIAWGPRRTLPLPAGTLDRARNTITFTTAAANPPWPQWGVRNVSLVPGSAGGHGSRRARVRSRLRERLRGSGDLPAPGVAGAGDDHRPRLRHAGRRGADPSRREPGRSGWDRPAGGGGNSGRPSSCRWTRSGRAPIG